MPTCTQCPQCPPVHNAHNAHLYTSYCIMLGQKIRTVRQFTKQTKLQFRLGFIFQGLITFLSLDYTQFILSLDYTQFILSLDYTQFILSLDYTQFITRPLTTLMISHHPPSVPMYQPLPSLNTLYCADIPVTANAREFHFTVVSCRHLLF